MAESFSKESCEQMSSLVDGELVGDAADLCAAWKDEASARASWHTYHLIGDTLRSQELATDPDRACDFLAAFRARLAAEPALPASLAAASLALSPPYYEDPAAAPVAAVARPVVADMDVRAARLAAAGASRVRPGRRWRMPISVAAGALAVTGVLMVARVSGVLPSSVSAGEQLAQRSNPVVGSQPAMRTLVDNQSGLRTVSDSAIDSSAAARHELTDPQPQTLIANGKLIRDARLDQYLAAHKQFGGSTALGVPSGFLRSATSEGRDR